MPRISSSSSTVIASCCRSAFRKVRNLWSRRVMTCWQRNLVPRYSSRSPKKTFLRKVGLRWDGRRPWSTAVWRCFPGPEPCLSTSCPRSGCVPFRILCWIDHARGQYARSRRMATVKMCPGAYQNRRIPNWMNRVIINTMRLAWPAWPCANLRFTGW